jgi:hypothetical protein
MDVIASLTHLTQTGSQFLKIKKGISEQHPDFFDGFVKERLQEIKQHYSKFLADVEDAIVPIYFVRYEELIDDPY